MATDQTKTEEPTLEKGDHVIISAMSGAVHWVISRIFLVDEEDEHFMAADLQSGMTGRQMFKVPLSSLKLHTKGYDNG